MGSKLYFNDVAQNWDDMRMSFFSDNLREKAIAIADVEENEIAADVGAGTGYMTDSLLRKGLRVVAVDESEKMINIIESKFSDNVDAKIGSAEKLPIEDNSVDYSFANMYLHHVENPGLAIKEMVRILKPSGKLIITDLNKHEYEFLRKEQNDRWLGFEHEDIKRWFKAAGLGNVSVECANEDCSTNSQNSGEKVKIDIFMAYGEK